MYDLKAHMHLGFASKTAGQCSTRTTRYLINTPSARGHSNSPQPWPKRCARVTIAPVSQSSSERDRLSASAGPAGFALPPAPLFKDRKKMNKGNGQRCRFKDLLSALTLPGPTDIIRFFAELLVGLIRTNASTTSSCSARRTCVASSELTPATKTRAVRICR